VRSESECTMIVRESADALAEEEVIYGLARIISTRSIVLKFIKSVLLLLLLFGAVVNAEDGGGAAPANERELAVRRE